MFVSCRLCPVRHREPEREQKPARADRYGTVRGQRSAFGAEDDEWHHHLLHRDAAVLERVLVVADEAVGVIVIDEKIGVVGEDIARREVDARQLDVFRPRDFVDFARVVGEVAPRLVAQVGRGLAVARHADRVVDADRAVVGGDDDRVPASRGV